MTVLRRTGGIGAFLVERCLPVYPVYLALWVIAVECMVVVVGQSSGPWQPAWDTALKILALNAAGAFLRMVDDQKDLDYDRVYNPDRPLVQGRISTRELRIAMVPAAAVAVLLAATVSVWTVVLVALILGYSLVLWWLESRVPVVRDSPLVNLAAACPAQFLATGFAMTGRPGVGDASWGQLVAVLLVFTTAFLHVELARKTTRTAAADDLRSYSRVIGPTASGGMVLILGVSAVLVEVLLTSPWSWAGHWWPIAWLPAAAAVLPCLSAWIFFVRRVEVHPRGLPMLFVIVFYLAIVGQGLVYH
ncbi:UbiA family prenyltransferase [Mycolicibacterium psychrotolerans]|uniref:UbiA family prenyltransferase n=1 Tax=Mycolicibacterium psychrotolerans TaxID=216929 RepID=UPI003D66E7D5